MSNETLIEQLNKIKTHVHKTYSSDLTSNDTTIIAYIYSRIINEVLVYTGKHNLDLINPHDFHVIHEPEDYSSHEYVCITYSGTPKGQGNIISFTIHSTEFPKG
jgi:hypothetical protein